jgi:hypothetical protein
VITFKTRRGLFAYRTKWFAERPSAADARGLVHYIQSPYQGRIAGFKREPFSTLIVPLDADEEMLFAACGRNTRYKVQRAIREGAIASNEADWQRFVAFYNVFAERRGLAALDNCSALKQIAIVRKATQGGVELVMHSYLIDHDIGRARLLHSASLLHCLAERASRAAVGRANRFLHYDDVLYFKRLGLRTYDFGGYALDALAGDLVGVNRFKEGFGGRLLEEANYTSIPLWLLRRLRATLDGTSPTPVVPSSSRKFVVEGMH